jgi:glucokinase
MIVGIDIGGTKCAVVTGDTKGNIFNKTVIKTTTFPQTYAAIIEIIKTLSTFETIGISCGGPLDEEKGVILSPPNLPDWDRVEIIKDLTALLNVPTKIRNDANACALAEYTFGAGKGCKNMVFLTFGTGMGAGIVTNGKLYGGTNGNAGEIGHIRMAKNGPVGYGKMGSFEGFCSGQGIRQLGRIYAERALKKGIAPSYTQIDDYGTPDIANAARAGDKTARAVFDKCGKMLGMGLSYLIDILNPQKIVIGSVFARCQDLLEPPMQRVLKKECLGIALDVCQVVPAALGETIGDVAAIAVATEAYYETH